MSNETLRSAIDALCAGADLDEDQARAALAEIMEGRAGEAQTAALLIGLRAKGETPAEVAGLAATMRALATPVSTERSPLVDTAGTGGGGSTFNVSTAAAIVAAGAGCAVAKHGNRSNTSRCGSADVLEALGVTIDVGPQAVGRCIDEIGFGFMFAPAHHSAMKHVAGVRRELGVRTVFNFLGPLTNPAGATRQVVGVADPAYQDVIATALGRLGCERAWVVNSADGLDEISVFAPTRVVELAGGAVREWTIDPEALGLAGGRRAEVEGAEPEANAALIRSVLDGAGGPARELVVVNAAAAIAVGSGGEGLEAGLESARESIDSGAAGRVLERLVTLSADLAERGSE